jgi:hypothetical protein
MLKEIVKCFDMGRISDMIHEVVRKSCVSVVTLSKKEEEEVSITVETVEPTKVEGEGKGGEGVRGVPVAPGVRVPGISTLCRSRSKVLKIGMIIWV